MDRTRILFVDDETTVLNGLRRMLYKMSSVWQMEFAPGGEAALNMLRLSPYDILVTDMRMPGVDGAQLLTHVQATYPETIRFVLSGQPDQRDLVQAAGLAHQFLAKPCDADTLKEAIRRAEFLRTLLTHPVLQQLVTGMQGLPVVPAILAELMAALASPDSSLKKVGGLIARDVALTAKVLQLVNSPLFGLRQSIHSPEQAVVLLGLETISALVMAVSTFDVLKGKWPPALLQSLYDHAFRVGQLAKRIAVDLGQPDTREWALVGGILHDVGKLILQAKASAAVQQIDELVAIHDISRYQAENEVLGVSHAEIGAYLLGLWGFNEQVVQAVACHHQSPVESSRPFDVATIVFAANTLDHARHPTGPGPETADLSCLDHLHIGDRTGGWQSFFK